MEVVIDSSFLRSPELRDFLARSPRNKAVLTDYSAMEAYKNADPVAVMRAQMEIVSDYPRQVIVLKSTADVAVLRGRKAGLRRRMIDGDQTANFPEFCRALRHDRALERTMNERAVTARSNIDAITADMPELIASIGESAKIYNTNELRILRTGGAFTDAMIEKFTGCTIMLAMMLHKRQPNSRGRPKFEEMPNTFLFRTAMCMELMVLKWAKVGRATAQPENVRNDVVDLSFATYGSFFDDLFTHDRPARSLYTNLKAALSMVVPAGIMP